MRRWLRSSLDSSRRPRLWAALALAVVCLLAWQLVGGLSTGLYRHFAQFGDPPLQTIAVPGPDPAGAQSAGPVSQRGHYGYFWSERAFHYRTTLAFATGRPAPSTLARDTFQQHPEGVNQWREYTLLMEPVYGFLYRLAGDPSRPVVEFLLGLVPLVHVLGLLPLYFVARRLKVRRPTAVAAVLVAATCGLAFTRLAGALLLKETFALALLWWFLALHLAAWRSGGRTRLVLAAVLLVPLLASWHLSQFLVALLMGATALARALSLRDEDRDPGWWMPAAYMAALVVAGLTPSLAARRFLLDAPAALMAAWLVAELVLWRWRPGSAAVRLVVLVVAVAALVAPTLVHPAHGGAYGHVGGLVAAKVSHGFRLPDDPALLAPAVRLFWSPPFHTPSLAEIWEGTGAHAVLFLAALLWGAVALLRRGTSAPQRAWVLAAWGLALAWLAVARLGVAFVPVAAVLTAVAADSVARRRSAWWPAAVLVAAGLFNLGTVLTGPVGIALDTRRGRPVRLQTAEDSGQPARVELLRWLTRHTPGPGSTLRGEAAAVLADLALSPQILLYAGRPVVLNSQFENTAIQERYTEFLGALYDRDPSRLHAFATAHEARYVVLPRRAATADGRSSMAWMAAAERPLHWDQTAVRLHFRPLEVPGFQPVWDNDRYRVFRVLPAGRRAEPDAWTTGFSPVWNPANFTRGQERLTDLEGDRGRLANVEARVEHLQAAQQRILSAGGGRGDLMAAQRRLALLRFDSLCGGPADPVAEARLANRIQTVLATVDPRVGRSTEQSLAELLDGSPRGAGWRQVLAAFGETPQHLAVAAQLASAAGRYEEAADLFAAAATRWGFPCRADAAAPEMRRRLWDETALWLVAAGRVDRARAFVRERADCAGDTAGAGALVRRLAATAPGEY